MFVGQPSGGEVNPVLWSLVPGAFCCAVLPVIAGLPHRRRLAALALATAGCGAAALYLRHGVNGLPASLFRVSLPDFLGVVPFFAAGAFLRTLERDMPGLYRADFAMLAFALNWIVASWLEWWDVPIAWLTLPYMAICFGRLSNPVSRWIAARTDLSYGLFLYAFPLQQAMLALLPDNRYAIPAALGLTVVAAFLSWRFVEWPAIRWRQARSERLLGGGKTANP